MLLGQTGDPDTEPLGHIVGQTVLLGYSEPAGRTTLPPPCSRSRSLQTTSRELLFSAAENEKQMKGNPSEEHAPEADTGQHAGPAASPPISVLLCASISPSLTPDQLPTSNSNIDSAQLK